MDDVEDLISQSSEDINEIDHYANLQWDWIKEDLALPIIEEAEEQHKVQTLNTNGLMSPVDYFIHLFTGWIYLMSNYKFRCTSLNSTFLTPLLKKHIF